MKVTLIQMDIVWGDPQANIATAETAINEAVASDVYVLPEMFSTGFATSPEGIAESDERSLGWMKQMAARMDAAICGSVATEIEKEGKSSYVNRFYFVKPDGETAYYDKRHLFTYGGEHRRYTHGGERVEVEFRGVRFLLRVCYDLRFPVFSRNNGDKPYDVAIYVASWPTSRMAVWDTLLRARAIENQCLVIGVNRVGNDEVCHYNGGTVLVDAYGNTVAECESGKESTITAVLDIDKLNAFRQKFPVLADADRAFK